MANPFDQFDQAPQSAAPTAPANPFDQFDSAMPSFSDSPVGASPIKFKNLADMQEFRQQVYPEKGKLSDQEFADWFGKSREIPTTVVIGETPDTTSGMDQQATKAEIDKLPYWSRPGLTDKIIHGMTLGLDTEAAGLASGVGSLVSGGSFGEGYNKGRQDYSQRLEYVDQAHPVASTAADIGGMIASPIGATTKIGEGLVGLGRMARQGAIVGGVSGFESSNEPLTDRLENAAVGAGVGSVVAPIVGHFVGGVTNLAGDVVSAVRNRGVGTGAELVARKLAEDNISPSDAAAAMEAAQKSGTPTVLADLGENMRALGGSVSRQPGSARSIAKTFTEQRQLGQGERIKDAINRDLGRTTDILEESERLMKGAREASNPLYEKFYSEPAKHSQRIEALLNTRAGKTALQRAAEIADNEGEDLTKLGFSVKRDGSVELNPVRIDLHSQLATARAERDSAQAALESARRGVLSGGGAGRVSEAVAALRAAEERFVKAQAALDAAPSSGTSKVVQAYTPRTIQYVKRGLDDVIQAQPRDPASGRIIMDERARSVESVRQRFVQEADRLWESYKPARDAYAGPAKMREALEAGKKAINKSSSEIKMRLKGMTATEKEQYSLGLRSAIADKLEMGGDSANKVRQLIASPSKRKALQAAFGGKAKFDRFLSTLENEQKAFETYASVHRGSQTAERMAEDANNAHKLFTGAVRDAADIAGGGHLGVASVAIRRAGEAVKFGVGKAGQRAREDAASLLFSSDPREFTNAMTERNARVNARQIRSNALTNFSRSRGAHVGSTSGAAAGSALLRYNIRNK